MKKAYEGFEAKKSGSAIVDLPPKGAYVGEIQGVKVEDSYNHEFEQLVLMLEVTEGEYKGRYHEHYANQKERFGDNVKYRGSLRIRIPTGKDGEDEWIRRQFEGAMWAVEDSNDGYAFDWDETKLKGKKVGFSVRDTYYTYGDKDYQGTEIGRLESIKEVKAGKVRPMKERDSRKNKTEETAYTNVSSTVDVPF